MSENNSGHVYSFEIKIILLLLHLHVFILFMDKFRMFRKCGFLIGKGAANTEIDACGPNPFSFLLSHVPFEVKDARPPHLVSSPRRASVTLAIKQSRPDGHRPVQFGGGNA